MVVEGYLLRFRNITKGTNYASANFSPAPASTAPPAAQ